MHAPASPRRSGAIIAPLVTLLLAATLQAQDEPPRPQPVPPPPPATAPPPQPSSPLPATVTQREDLALPRDIIERCLEAMGGREAFDRMTSSFAKVDLRTPTGLVQLEMSWMTPNRILVKSLGDATTETSVGFNGEVAWAHDHKGYKILTVEEASLLQREASMFRMVLRLEIDHKDLKTVDQLEFAGQDCYKVASIDPDGQEQFTFFDVDEHLIRGTEAAAPGKPSLIMRFSEWKEDQGIKHFSKADIEQAGGAPISLTFTEVKFNTLDESVFALPPEVQAMLKDRAAPATRPVEPATAPSTLPDNGAGG